MDTDRRRNCQGHRQACLGCPISTGKNGCGWGSREIQARSLYTPLKVLTLRSLRGSTKSVASLSSRHRNMTARRGEVTAPIFGRDHRPESPAIRLRLRDRRAEAAKTGVVSNSACVAVVVVEKLARAAGRVRRRSHGAPIDWNESKQFPPSGKRFRMHETGYARGDQRSAAITGRHRSVHVAIPRHGKNYGHSCARLRTAREAQWRARTSERQN